MAEPGKGRLGKPPQLIGRKVLTGEQRDKPGRELGIGQARIILQGRRAELGQSFWHVEAPILGETGQKHLYEREGGW